MKIPICSFDAKAGVLCPKCESKLNAGHISQMDVDASCALTKIADSFPELNKVTLVRAIEVDGDCALMVGTGNSGIIRSDPTTLKKLEEHLQKKVWTIEGESSTRKMVEDLFYPAKVSTVNVVWLPDGSKLTKVIVRGRKSRTVPINTEKVKKVVKATRGIDLLVESERE